MVASMEDLTKLLEHDEIQVLREYREARRLKYAKMEIDIQDHIPVSVKIVTQKRLTGKTGG